MRERIRYHVNADHEQATDLRVIASTSLLQEAKKYEPNIRFHVEHGFGRYGVKEIARVEPSVEGNRHMVIYPLYQISNRRNNELRQRDIRAAIATIAAVEMAAGGLAGEEEERSLQFFLSLEPLPDGLRLPMSIDIRKPTSHADQIISKTATDTMRAVAKAIRYAHKNAEPRERYERRVAELVYAHYDHKNGTVLETNPMGSCSVGTDGSSYFPEDEIMELTAHNLYSPEQQLICLAGAIAIASLAED